MTFMRVFFVTAIIALAFAIVFRLGGHLGHWTPRPACATESVPPRAPHLATPSSGNC